MELTTLLVYVLATWRVASLFVHEAGPGDLFFYMRKFAGIEHDDDKQITIIPDNFLAGVLSCVWCSSLWVAAFWILFDMLLPVIALRFAAVFAVSAGAIFLETIRLK